MSEPKGQKLPPGWQQTDLGTVISLNYGKGLPEEMRQSGNFPVYGSNGRVGTHSEAFIEGPAIIVGRKGTVGAVHFESGPCWPIDTTYFVNHFPQLHPRFVYYQLIHLRLGQFDKSTAIPGISRTDVYAKSFVLCSLREQERIVDALDELFSDLDASVAALERVRKKLKLYRASVLKAAVEGALTAEWRQEHPHIDPARELLKRILAERRRRWEVEQLTRFKANDQEPPKDWKSKYKEPITPDATKLPRLPKGWCWATLDQLSSLVTSGSRAWKKYYSHDGASFIRSQDIRTDQLEIDNVAHVTPPKNSEGTRTHVRRGDLLVTITGANVAKAAVAEIELSEAYVSQHVGLIRFVEPGLGKFVHTYAVAPSGGRKKLLGSAYGAGKPGLSLDNLREMTLPLPPNPELDALVETVEDQISIIDHLEADLDAKLKTTQTLRQAILRHAFNGMLVPQDPNDEPAAKLLKRIAMEREQRASEAVAAKRSNGSRARRKLAENRHGTDKIKR